MEKGHVSEKEKDRKRHNINSDRAELLRAWQRSLCLPLRRCVDEVMGWWWHLEMEGWRWRGRWRANAYRLWPLGSETPLFWQGWVESPLKALDSSSDLTTISAKLVRICLNKWTWQPPTMRSPCRLTTPLAYRLVQARVCLQGFVYFYLLPTGVLMSVDVTIRVARTGFLLNDHVISVILVS